MVPLKNSIGGTSVGGTFISGDFQHGNMQIAEGPVGISLRLAAYFRQLMAGLYQQSIPSFDVVQEGDLNIHQEWQQRYLYSK